MSKSLRSAPLAQRPQALKREQAYLGIEILTFIRHSSFGFRHYKGCYY